MPAQADYPIEIRKEDLSISMHGDLLITGPPAEKLRRLLLSYPAFYPKFVVPFMRKREATFKPDELWIDPFSRVHITNRLVVQRMRSHLTSALRRRRPR